jgi:antitoxin component YwqK of YwqJK toxin-antitoxin module
VRFYFDFPIKEPFSPTPGRFSIARDRASSWGGWHENGQKKREATFKDGKRDGLLTFWHENGQKQGESTFKEGEQDGLHTEWYENGQKRREATFKDGERVSAKYWNSKGEEVETGEEALEKPATEPSGDTAKPPPAEPPVAESPSESATPPSEDVKPSADSPEPLISDADLERFAKDALDTGGKGQPSDYTGWTKIGGGGHLYELVQWKNGKPDGRYMAWYENGKIMEMGINKGDKEGDPLVEFRSWYESGEKESEVTTANDGSMKGSMWHKNGQKMAEATAKPESELVSKYWNSKGEEVETEKEARK